MINPNEEFVNNDLDNINDVYFKLPNLVIILFYQKEMVLPTI